MFNVMVRFGIKDGWRCSMQANGCYPQPPNYLSTYGSGTGGTTTYGSFNSSLHFFTSGGTGGTGGVGGVGGWHQPQPLATLSNNSSSSSSNWALLAFLSMVMTLFLFDFCFHL